MQLNVDLCKVSFSIITLYLHALHMHLEFFHAFDVYMFYMVKVVGVNLPIHPSFECGTIVKVSLKCIDLICVCCLNKCIHCCKVSFVGPQIM